MTGEPMTAARVTGSSATGSEPGPGVSLRRWLKFNLVGIVGFVVQVSLLNALVRWMYPHYLLATALAVEVTVIHNFLWHERFTWADRKSVSAARRWRRFLHFNLGNGAVSLLGNLIVMRLLVGELGLPYLPGSIVSVLACAVVNFLLCDGWVFRAANTHIPRTYPVK